MRKRNQSGDLLIPLVLVSVCLLGAIGFGVWAFMGRQDYKNNVDLKIEEAVEVAEENLTIKKDAEFAEQYKLPNSTYTGPSALGTLKITYPKTWSVYADENSNSTASLKGFMHPRYVPAKDTNYALRFEVLERNYDQVLKSFNSKVKAGKTKVSAYRLPKLKSILGSKLVGEIDSKKSGVIILLPLRDKTVKVWTEGNEFRGDFDKILESFTFVP